MWSEWKGLKNNLHLIHPIYLFHSLDVLFQEIIVLNNKLLGIVLWY